MQTSAKPKCAANKTVVIINVHVFVMKDKTHNFSQAEWFRAEDQAPAAADVSVNGISSKHPEPCGANGWNHFLQHVTVKV